MYFILIFFIRNGFLAVGGQRSQLMVKQLNGQWYAQTVVGGSINNALCISNHPYGTRLYICNNDETIKIYTLPGLQRVEFISLPTAVNYGMKIYYYYYNYYIQNY